MWPVDFGGAARTFNLAQALTQIGHKVSLLSPAPVTRRFDNDLFQWRSYRYKGGAGHFWNGSFLKALRELLTAEVDLLVAEFPYQSMMLTRLARQRGIPVVYDAHNVERDRFHAMGKPLKAVLVGLSESHLLRRARAVLAVTDREARVFLQRYTGSDVRMLPNGVNLQRFHYAPADRSLLEHYGLIGRKVVVFFGALDYSPNTQALEYLLHRIWPEVSARLPHAVLLVVGRQPPRWAQDSDNVRVIGVVEDIVAHIRLADLIVVPLFSGGGSRLKIIEALACARTVLSTAAGAEGIPRGDGNGLVIRDIDDFAAAVIDLLDNDRSMPNESAREIARSFGWLSLVQRIDWRGLAGKGDNAP